jgi:hypothetical protein
LEFYRIDPYGLLCDFRDNVMMNSKSTLKRISAIRNEPNTEKRLAMLQQLNESLPADMKLDMPSLITNAYVRKALDTIEEKISLSV